MLSSQVFLTEEDFIMDKFLDTLQEKLGPIAYKLNFRTPKKTLKA